MTTPALAFFFHSAYSPITEETKARELQCYTVEALFLNVPLSLWLVFIIALTDAMWNRDFWILSLSQQNHVGDTGKVLSHGF